MGRLGSMVIGFMVIGIVALSARAIFESGQSETRRLELCPALLAAQETLADSLTVAQKYHECEWWNEEEQSE